MGSQSNGGLSADGRWRLSEFYFWETWVTRLYDFDEDYTGTQHRAPPPVGQLTQMRDNYGAWYRDVHTVETEYVQDGSGGGVLKGMSFQRTPGFMSYTFGIGIPDELDGQIAAQAGIWEMSRSGNTVTAQFGDLILWGEIENSSSCHSIVISGNFNRSLGGNPGPYSMTLNLFIDGMLSHTSEMEATLATADPTIETIIGDPGNPAQSGTLLPPVIMNTTLTSSTPVTVESFGRELCNTSV